MATWNSCEWEGKESATFEDLPTITKYINGASPGVYPVLKVVFLPEKKLFLLETVAFKVFYGKSKSEKEYNLIASKKVSEAFYAIEIRDSNWRLLSTEATAKYDRTDKKKCIVWEAPPTVSSLDEAEDNDEFVFLDRLPF